LIWACLAAIGGVALVVVALIELHASTPHEGAVHKDEFERAMHTLERIQDKVDDIHEKVLTSD